MSEPFLDRLRQGPILCDGAMGTMLYAQASESSMHGRCFDELVLSEPDLVQGIHRAYINAGAQVIETNTFGANAFKLGSYGLADRVREINRKAVQLAREAREIAGRAVFVAGAVGPSGQLIGPAETLHETHLEALRSVFREQIGALLDGGADLIILETFSSLIELRQAVLAARDLARVPLVAQMTFAEDGQSLAGDTPAQAALTLARAGVDVIGVNCSIGPAGTFDAIREMVSAVRESGNVSHEVMFSAQPNAGLPTRVENRFLYVSSPGYFADYARQFAGAGTSLIGGCCGTTPAHIAAMHSALADYLPASGPTTWEVSSPPTPRPSVPAVIAPDVMPQQEEGVPGRFAQMLHAGSFAVSIELDPPKGLNPGKIIEGATYLRSKGVELINIADSPMARVRMSCLALASMLQQELDVEAIVHFTTRDRNVMALQSDLLGAHAQGIRNILALTGDPLRMGNYPNLTGVWDMDSVGLVRVLKGMNDGHDAAGASLGSHAQFFIGAALNLNMEDAPIDVTRERARRKLLDIAAEGPNVDENEVSHMHPLLTETELELHRLRHKLDAGAQFIMTQPIYDLEPLERFTTVFGRVGVPVILGMIPLHSSRHAEYLHNEVPGISIPDEVRARMREAGDRGREVGIALARDVIVAARDRGLIQGAYLMPSYGRYDLVGELAQELLRTPATSRGDRP